MSHSGKEWDEVVLDHVPTGGMVSVHKADETDIVHYSDHDGDWMEYTSRWKRTCCRCGNITFFIERDKVRDNFKSRRDKIIP